MRLGLDVTTDGALAAMAARVEDPVPGLRAAAAAFRQRQVRVFATRGGGTWAPDDPSTVARKGTSRVLVGDGGLLRSLTVEGDRYAVERYEGDSVVVGTRNPVAHLHRDGARGMPRRNPVPPPTAAETAQLADPVLGYIIGDGL